MQLRKVIHISGVLIPAAATVIGKSQVIIFVLFGLSVFIIVEVLKTRINNNILLIFYRESELKGMSIEPLSYFISVLSLLLLSYFIDENICYAAIAILAAGDGVAGVFGRRFGRHRYSFNRNKSWEGTLSGFAVASITGFYYAGSITLPGSFFGMLAGAVNKYDNIAVPYTAFFSMLIIDYVTMVF